MSTPPHRPLSGMSEWLRTMAEGQNTRDPVLRTRSEIQQDKRLAEAVAKLRQASTATDKHPK